MKDSKGKYNMNYEGQDEHRNNVSIEIMLILIEQCNMFVEFHFDYILIKKYINKD